jgi:hypothetical protein
MSKLIFSALNIFGRIDGVEGTLQSYVGEWRSRRVADKDNPSAASSAHRTQRFPKETRSMNFTLI